MISTALLDAVLERSTGKGSRVHGPIHWAGVAAAGYALCEMVPEADPFVVLLFSVCHDAMRKGDGRDPGHGFRAAVLARELRDAGVYALDEGRMVLLEEALIAHDGGETSADPTVGACWDADRLNLKRVGIKPAARFMSTPAGRYLVGTHNPTLFASMRFDWRAIFLNFGAKIAGRPGAVYLRFGDLPEGGISHCWPNTPEHGVSVFEGYENAPDSYRIDARRLMLGTETRLVRWLMDLGRPLYVVDGRRVGMGGSGEPLLADARVVREVNPADSLVVMPDHPELGRCVGAWKARNRGRPPLASWSATPIMHLPALPEDRELSFSAVSVHSTSSVLDDVRAKFREALAGYGVLADYERMRASSSRPRPRSPDTPEALAPWTPPPEPEGLKRWREFQEQQRAMAEQYERWTGGR